MVCGWWLVVWLGQGNLTGQEREALWAELGLKKKSKQLSVAERGEE